MDDERAAATRTPQRLWIAAAVTACAGLGLVGWVAKRGSHPAAAAVQRASPPPAGVFRSGGPAPALSATLRQAFGERLPDWVIAIDRRARAQRSGGPDGGAATAALAAARADLSAAALRRELGDRAADALVALLDRAEATFGARSAEERELRSLELFAATRALDDELAAAGLPLLLVTDVLERDDQAQHVLFYSFAVHHVRRFQLDDQEVRAVQVRRLDPLNLSHRLLGFTSPHLRDAVVLLDQVDGLLVGYVVPALADGAPVYMTDPDSADPDAGWQAELAARAGAVIREDYAVATGFDRAEAAALGAALGRRRTLFARWQDRLGARDIVLRTPDSVRLPDLERLSRALAGLVDDAELAELEALQRGLDSREVDRVFDAVRDVLITSVERHELQHRIEVARAQPLPFPDALARFAGPLAAADGTQRPLAARARDELSAYLAELARDDTTPRVNLTLLARFAFDRRAWGGAECAAALTVLDGLARELELPSPGALIERGEVVRERLAPLYLAAAGVSTAELRSAARRLWERLFGEPLPPIHPAPAPP
jgi:hypothetical protein